MIGATRSRKPIGRSALDRNSRQQHRRLVRRAIATPCSRAVRHPGQPRICSCRHLNRLPESTLKQESESNRDCESLWVKQAPGHAADHNLYDTERANLLEVSQPLLNSVSEMLCTLVAKSTIQALRI